MFSKTKHAIKVYRKNSPVLQMLPLPLLFFFIITCPTIMHNGCHAQSSGLNQTEYSAMLSDLRGNGFLTAVAVLSFVPRSAITRPATLLVPIDAALSNITNYNITSENYLLLLLYHLVRGNLSSGQLRLLPVGTWIPTYLSQAGVQVTANDNAAGLALDHVRLVGADVCPNAGPGISCQGMAGVLLPDSLQSATPPPRPLAPQPGPAPAPGPAPEMSPTPQLAAAPTPGPQAPSAVPGPGAGAPLPGVTPASAPATPPPSPPPPTSASSTASSPASSPSLAPPPTIISASSSMLHFLGIWLIAVLLSCG